MLAALLACQSGPPPENPEAQPPAGIATAAPQASVPLADKPPPPSEPAVPEAVAPLRAKLRTPHPGAEAAEPPKGLAELKGPGEPILFNLIRATDYFGQLPAFALEWIMDVRVETEGGESAQSTQRVAVRQGYEKEFQIDFSVRTTTSGQEGVQESGYSAIRKGPWFYFRVGEGSYLRKRATDSMSASRYVDTSGLQAYLDLMQQGAKFVVGRARYLGRSVRTYRMSSALPLEENPVYQGKLPERSAQEGEVWVDEASSLVLKFDYRVRRDTTNKAGQRVHSDERNRVEVTGLGGKVTITAPTDFIQQQDSVGQDAVRIPVLQDPR